MTWSTDRAEPAPFIHHAKTRAVMLICEDLKTLGRRTGRAYLSRPVASQSPVALSQKPFLSSKTGGGALSSGDEGLP